MARANALLHACCGPGMLHVMSQLLPAFKMHGGAKPGVVLSWIPLAALTF
jgi:hypothetical protein